MKRPFWLAVVGCLYAFTGHVVTMLGRGAQIVAVSKGLKRDTLLHRICPQILDAAVPKSKGAVNIEELLKARIDIVFIPGEIGRNDAGKFIAGNSPLHRRPEFGLMNGYDVPGIDPGAAPFRRQ